MPKGLKIFLSKEVTSRSWILDTETPWHSCGPWALPVLDLASELLLQREGIEGVGGAGHHSRLLVLAHSLLEEVGLALQRNQLHPVKWVAGSENLAVAESCKKPVCNKLNVLRHEVLVHADKIAGECVANELSLNLHRAPDDVVHDVLCKLVLQHLVQEAGKVGVEALVSGNQLVGEGEARHLAALLQPEDGAERPAEEHALDRSEGHQALRKAALAVHPLYCPVRLLAHRGHGVDGIKEAVPLPGALDVLLDQQGVCLGVNVFHGNLKAIEGPRLRNLNLRGELRCQVLQDNAIRGRKEGQDVLDEMLLALGQLHPVLAVLREVDLLSCPEGSFVLLVHLPNLGVLQWEHDPTLRVLSEKGILLLQPPVLLGDAAAVRGGGEGLLLL